MIAKTFLYLLDLKGEGVRYGTVKNIANVLFHKNDAKSKKNL